MIVLLVGLMYSRIWVYILVVNLPLSIISIILFLVNLNRMVLFIVTSGIYTNLTFRVVLECIKALFLLGKENRLKLTWVSGYSDVAGDEKADILPIWLKQSDLWNVNLY